MVQDWTQSGSIERQRDESAPIPTINVFPQPNAPVRQFQPVQLEPTILPTINVSPPPPPALRQPVVVDRVAYLQDLRRQQEQAYRAQSLADYQRKERERILAQLGPERLASALQWGVPKMAQIASATGENILGQMALEQRRVLEQRGYRPGTPAQADAEARKWGATPGSPVYDRIYQQTLTYGHALTPTEEVELGLRTPADVGAPLRAAYKVARTEIPGAQQAADIAGEIGQRVGETALRTAVGPAGIALEQTPLPEAAGKAGELVAESLVPTEVWMAALELVPGVGTVPDLVRAVRRGSPEAVAALSRVVGSDQAQSIIRRLASERGGMILPEPERLARMRELRSLIPRIEKDIDAAVGAERRAALLRQLDETRSELAGLENQPLAGQADMFGGVAEEAPVARPQEPQQGDIFAQPQPEPLATGAGAEIDAAQFQVNESRGLVPPSMLRTHPALQARVTDAGKTYKEATVRQIVGDFDQDKLTDLVVVRDYEHPGQFYIVAGHHRAEALSRLDKPAPVQIIEGLDVRNADDLARIQEIADASNIVQRPLSLKERINVVQRRNTEDVAAIRSALPAFKDQDIADALNIGRLPGHIVDTLDQLPPDAPQVGIAAEIGHGMRRYGLTVEDGEALYSRLTKGAKKALPTRAGVRETIDRLGPAYQRAIQADMFAGEPGVFGARSRFLDVLDEHARLSSELRKKIRQASSDIKALLRRGIAEDAPQVEAIKRELDELEGRRVQLEADVGVAISDLASASASSPAEATGRALTVSGETLPAGTQRPPESVSTTGEGLPSGSTTRRSEPSEALRGATSTEEAIAGSVPPERALVPRNVAVDEVLRADDFTERGLGPPEPPRRVEGEIIDEPPTTVMRQPRRPRLLPFQISVTRLLAKSFPETPGTKVAGAVRRVPLGKHLMRRINPSATDDFLTQLTTAYKRAIVQGDGTNQVGIAYLTDRPLPFRLGGEGVVLNLPRGSKYGPKATAALVPPGTRTGGFEGEHIIDILERATVADVGAHITPGQWGWIQTARNIIDDALDDLLAAHGTVRGTPEARKVLAELGFGPGEHYFPRRVIGREGVDGARAALAGGRGSIGARKFFEKSRLHEYVAEGVANGLDYDDPLNAMRTYLTAMRRRTADAELLRIAKMLGKTREDLALGENAYTGALPGVPFGRTGIIPTRGSQLPGLQGMIFPADTIGVIERELTDQGAQWLKIVADLNSVARFTKAGLDLGAPFIHGWPVLFRNTAAWSRATVNSYRAFVNPAVRSRWLLENRWVMQEYLDAGGELTTPEFFDAVRPGSAVARIPVVGPVTRAIGQKVAERPAAAFDMFLDASRIELWKAARQGIRTESDRYLRMGVIRNLTGTTSLTQAGISRTQQDVENIVLWFATRYTKSAAALAGNLLGGRATAPEAARALASLMAGTSLFMYGAAKATGMSDDEIRQMFSPSAGRRFMSIKVGGNYIGPGGVYRSLMQLGARSIETARTDPQGFASMDFERNPLFWWFRSRTSPLASTVVDFWTGRDFRGNEISGWQDWLRVLADKFNPLTIDAVIESRSDDPADRAIAGVASFVGLRQVPFRAIDLRDMAREDGAHAAGYKSWTDMRQKLGYTAAVKALSEASSEYAQLEERVRREGQERREDRGERALTDVLQRFTDEQRQADANPDLAEWQAWIDDRQARNQRKAGALDEWERTHPREAEFLNRQIASVKDPFALPASASPDEIKSAYLKVFKAHKTATGGIDDLDALGADLDRFTASLSEGQLAALYANINAQATPREQQYINLVRPLAAGGYFDRADAIFQQWRDGIPNDAPIKVASKGWNDARDLQRWAKDEVVRVGQPEQYYTFEPWWQSWERVFSDDNGLWLAQHPELDAIAIVLGYQQRTHSEQAERIYERLSGKQAPVPAD